MVTAKIMRAGAHLPPPTTKSKKKESENQEQ